MKVANGPANIRLDGPAPKTDKLLYAELVKRGAQEHEIPAFLRDNVVFQTPKDKIGQLKFRRLSGVILNETSAIVRRFEKAIGGKERLYEALEAISEKLTDSERELMEAIPRSSSKGISRLLAEHKLRPTRIMQRFAEGAQALGRTAALIEAAKEQPAIVKDLIRHGIDSKIVCSVCVGEGKVQRTPTAENGAKHATRECPQCGGTGHGWAVPSEHKQYALTALMRMTKLVEEKPAVAVQTNVGVNVSGGRGGFLENILQTNEKILYGRAAGVDATEVPLESSLVEEVSPVSPEDHSQGAPESRN